MSDKQAVGFLSLLEDVLRNLGSKVVPYWPALLGTTIGINIIVTAQSRIEKSSEDPAEKDEHDVEEEILEEEEGLDNETSASESAVSLKNFQINTTAWNKDLWIFSVPRFLESIGMFTDFFLIRLIL